MVTVLYPTFMGHIRGKFMVRFEAIRDGMQVSILTDAFTFEKLVNAQLAERRELAVA